MTPVHPRQWQSRMMNKAGHIETIEVTQQPKRQATFLRYAVKTFEGSAKIEQH